MKFTKFLLVASVAAISASAFASSGGFYIGINTGAQLDRYRAKVDSDTAKRKKTKIIAEAVVGYDFHFSSIVLGMDVEFGTVAGKVKLKDGERKLGSLKTPWHLGFMPRVGYLVSPNWEIYLTAGARIVKHKWEKKKTKVHPVAGLGVRYAFAQNFFVKAEYDHLFKSKIIKKKLTEGTFKPKYQVHSFKIGLGYKF